MDIEIRLPKTPAKCSAAAKKAYTAARNKLADRSKKAAEAWKSLGSVMNEEDFLFLSGHIFEEDPEAFDAMAPDELVNRIKALQPEIDKLDCLDSPAYMHYCTVFSTREERAAIATPGFFECNLPEKAPGYLCSAAIDPYERTAASLKERMEKLQKALELSRMKPETFQNIMGKLFKDEERTWGHVKHFDSMTAAEMSKYAQMAFVEDIACERCVFPNADVICDAVFATNEEWAGSLRRLGIGGSDSSTIQGLSHWQSKRGLYYSKIGQPIRLDIEPDKQKIFDRGHFNEDAVIERFCELHNATRIIDTRMFRSKTHPHCIADIDAMLEMEDGSLQLFEAKTTVTENSEAWSDGKTPPYYVCQTRHYPAVLDDDRISRTYIGALFVIDLEVAGKYAGSQIDGGKFVSHTIERNREEEQRLLGDSEKFWAKYVATGTLPPADGDIEVEGKVNREYIGLADPELPKENITSAEMLKLMQKWDDAKARAAALKKQAKAIEDDEIEAYKIALADRMQQAQLAEVIDPDTGTKWDIKYAEIAKKETPDLDNIKDLRPDLYEEYTVWLDKCKAVPACMKKGTPERRFTIKRVEPKKKK